MKAKEIALEALDVFGTESQIKRFAEEAVEAAHAALKLDRTDDDTRLVAEVGDLKLTLWQIEQFLGADRVKAATRRSALKLEKLIGDYKADEMRRGLGPIPPLDAGLYEATDKEAEEPVQIEVRYEYVTKPCGCCAKPKGLGRGLETLMGDEK